MMTDAELLTQLDERFLTGVVRDSRWVTSSIRLRVVRKPDGRLDYAAGTHKHAATLRGALENALERGGAA